MLLATVAFGEEALTLQQFKAETEFKAAAVSEGWTHEWDVTQVGRHSTGYIPSPHPKPGIAFRADGPMKGKDLTDFGKPLTRILNQGNCGSCVVFSIIANFMDTMKLRNMSFPELSPQHLMNCGTGYQCNGAYGEGIAGDLVKLKTLHAETDYRYTQSSGRCQAKSAPRYGKIESYETIDGSVRSILAAIHKGHAVSVGVAADSRWSSYKSGRYNGCGSMGTNHYVVIQGVDCETSVDADGFCKFDAKGNLPPGVGVFNIRNSWGTNWGSQGYMTSAITDKSGRRCNNIAGGDGNAQILDVGVPMPPVEPVKFTIERQGVTLKVEVASSAPYLASEAKRTLESALTSLGVK
jgi:hypothetical protein